MKDRDSQSNLGKPFPQSFWVREGLLCAGQYPGDLDPQVRNRKLQGLVDCGIRRIVNLMEAGETDLNGNRFASYGPQLNELAAAVGASVECVRLPIRDASVPTRPAMRKILGAIDDSLRQAIPTYLHCWGGHGRTGTVVACHLIRHGCQPREALDRVVVFRRGLPKSHFPFEGEQERFVLEWSEEVSSRFAE